MDATAAGPCSHRLEGRALKRWWQIDDLFKFRFAWQKNKEEDDKFSNVAIRQQLVFFATVPFVAGFFAHAVATSTVEHPDHWIVIWQFSILTSCLILVLFIHLLLALKKHFYRVLEVETTETGLRMRSPFLARSLRWDQIRELYVNQDGDLILESATGEEFILSNELTDSENLFSAVEKRAPKQKRFSYNYRFPNQAIDSFSAACLAVMVACLHIGLRPWMPMESFLSGLAISLTVCLFVTAIWRLQVCKLARLVRLSESSIVLATSKVSKEFAWEQISSVKKIGSFFLVNAQSDCFLVVAGKKEPVAARMVECKQRKKLIAG